MWYKECCKTKNPCPAKFGKGQNVRACKDGRWYRGTINCVMDMSDHYDYYVNNACSCKPETFRCHENDIHTYCYSCCNNQACGGCCRGHCPCHHPCHHCKQCEAPAPRFHIGQIVRTNDHCGVVIGIEFHGLEGHWWNCKVEMCRDDDTRIRTHAESFFETCEDSNKHTCASLPRAVLTPYITQPDQERGPALFEDLPSEKFFELYRENYIEGSHRFGTYDTLKELIEFLNGVPEFCVGGLYYEDNQIHLTEITCKVMIDDAKMIRYLKFARKADEFDTDNGNLRAWWD